MDLCVFDWRAITPIIAALIASGTAWGISNKWNNQKGSEVVASEAKQTIKDLLEVIKIVNYIKSGSYDERTDKEQFDRFELLFESIVPSILYIDDCIHIDDLKTNLFEFTSDVNELIKLKRNNSFNFNSEKYKNRLDSVIDSLSQHGMDVVNILHPYSIYRKKFKFKSK